MAIAMQKVLNDYAAALQQIDELEKLLAAEKGNAVNVVRGLISGELPKERVVVTDNGFEIMPEMPDMSDNGATPKQEKKKVKA